ncbi:sensor histidine kinase [Parachryseolinea silvisoli]|uniref:sensor histidine kinase n=1 Tax=Parachryseolinea silvisoli TaxID=2873601 RepID=UPI002265C71F|nr:sensor histidine kinase [Parachryseolinea silvisoli]MCD9016709.1 sensor histidine kinase [Parachryseolinea silvisoli]
MCIFLKYFCSVLAFTLLTSALTIQAQTFKIHTPFQEDSLRTVLRRSEPDTNKINTLLELGNPAMNITGKVVTDLDTAYKYIKQAEALSKLIQFPKGEILASFRLGYIFLQRGEEEASRAVVQRAIDLSGKNSYVRLEAQGWHFLGDSYNGLDDKNFFEKIRCFYQSVQLFEKSGDMLGAADMIAQIAEIENMKGLNTAAKGNLLHALEIYRSLGKESQYINQVLSRVERFLENYTEALDYGLSSLRIALKNRDSTNLSFIHLGLGVIYADLRLESEALKHYEEGLWYSRKQKIDYLAANAVALISQSFIRAHKPYQALDYLKKMERELSNSDEGSKRQFIEAYAECYTALKRFELAEKFIIQLIDFWESDPDQSVRMFGHQTAGRLYANMKMYEKSRVHLEKAIALNAKIRSSYAAQHQQLSLFKLDSARGKYVSAIAHYQNYKNLTDSIYNEKLSNQIADLQIKHETAEKEQRIDLLMKENLIQQSILSEQNFRQYVGVTGLVLLLCLLAITFSRFQIKKRGNALLQEKQNEINQKNESLQNILLEKENLLGQQRVLLEEKEWLLKENHHRVKNNLQIVMSLLNSQAAYLQDEQALSAIQNSQHRVYAISLIHQRLYKSNHVATIEMSSYLREIVDYLTECFNEPQKARFDLDIAPFELDVSVAVPLGLIINEAITNCLKYAFPDGRTGIVTIKLCHTVEKKYQLTIADNGVGVGQGVDNIGKHSLGMSLMNGLAKQLGGELQIENRNGLSVNVVFRM